MSLDLFIVMAFLIANLIFGIFSGLGIKNIKGYALGGRNFATSTIVATIAATWIGGSNFSITIAETHKQGIFFLVCSLAEAVSFWLIAYFYAPRMGEFLGKLSVADAMHDIYQSRYVRGIIAIFSTVPAVGRVAMQFLVLQAILNLWLGMSGLYAAALSSLIIITYSSFGGIKAVTFTDLIQFFTFGVVIPMVAFLVWKSFSDNEVIISTVMADPLFHYNTISDGEKQGIMDTLYLCLFLMIPLLDPAIFQRISMSKNTSQVSRSFLIAIFFILLCDALVHTVIGVLFRADPNIVDLNADNVIQYVMDHYLHYGFKGIFVVGIMSMVMSTADSYINSSAVLLSYDFPKALGIEINEKKQLQLARFCSLFVGMLALSVSLFAENLLALLLSVYSFYMPIVTVPFTLAIFGFRTTSRALLISMAVGFVTVVYFELFSDEYHIISGIPGTLVSLIFLIGSHYILREKGGWVGIKDQEQFDAVMLEKKQRRNCFVRFVKNFSLVKFCQNNTPNEERIFVYFGLFCIVAIFSNAYSLPRYLQEQYSSILDPIYYSVLILSTTFIIYPLWSKNFKNKVFISILWNIAIFYNLAFSSTFIVIISQFDQMQLTILMASLIVVGILMRWQVAILTIISGTIVSIWYYKIYVDVNFLPQNIGTLQFKITYSILLVTAMLIAFFKPKQERDQLIQDKAEHLDLKIQDQGEMLEKALKLKHEFLANLEHEGNTPISTIVGMTDLLESNYDKLSDDQIREGLNMVSRSSNRLLKLVNNLLDVSKLNSTNYQLDIAEVNLSELVYNRLEYCKRLYLENIDIRFITEIENNVNIKCDEYYIRATLDNLIVNAIKYGHDGNSGTIIIKLRRYDSEIEFSITDRGRGIPKQELLSIFDPFTVGSATRTKSGAIPNGQVGLGLALCKLVIKAHNGMISAKSDNKNGAVFKFTLPII